MRTTKVGRGAEAGLHGKILAYWKRKNVGGFLVANQHPKILPCSDGYGHDLIWAILLQSLLPKQPVFVRCLGQNFVDHL